MKKVETIGLFLIIILALYRIFLGVELQVLLRVALTLLSIFYLWFSFFLFNKIKIADLFSKNRKSEISKVTVTTSIVAGLVYSLSFIAILFVISFYPGMNRLIILSLIFNFALIIYSALVYFNKKEYASFIKQFFWRSIVLGALFFALWRTPVEVLLNKLYADYPSFIEAYNDYLDDPDSLEVQNKLKEERSAFR